MAEPEDTFWRAVAKIAEGRGTVTNMTRDVQEPYYQIGSNGPYVGRRPDPIHLRFEVIVTDLDPPSDMEVRVTALKAVLRMPPETINPRSVGDAIIVTRDAEAIRRGTETPEQQRRRIWGADTIERNLRRDTALSYERDPIAAAGARQAMAQIPTEHIHDVHCNTDRRRPRTPGANGCSCSPVPGEPVVSRPTTATHEPKPAAVKHEPATQASGSDDDAATRFRLMELD